MDRSQLNQYKGSYYLSIFTSVIFVFLLAFFSIAFYSLTNIPIFIFVPFFIFYIFGSSSLSVNFLFIAILIMFKNSFTLFSYLLLDDYFNHALTPLLLSVDYSYFIAISVFLFLLYYSKLNLVCLFACVIFLIYLVFGAFFSSFMSAATYSRFYLVPLFTILMVGFGKQRLNNLRDLIFGLVVVYGFYMLAEAFFPKFYDLIHINEFANIKYWKDPYKAASENNLVQSLGTSIAGVRITRLLGPQFHPISAGYMLLFMCCFLYAEKRVIFYFSLPFMLIGLLLTSKGAFVAAFCLLSVFIAKRITYFKRLIPFIFVVYTAAMFAISAIPGLTSGYEHLAGFIGAFKQFPFRPLGLGIGTGGTMSSFGGAEFGGESGFGVVLAHMGIIGLFLYSGLIFSLLKILKSDSNKIFIYSSYLLVVLLNGLLQEEALLPSASFLGWLLFSYYGLSYFQENKSLFSKFIMK
ncbi:hypothetical protein BCU24_21115 [Vibrio cyclitrophicus]|uniref:hypothetical protein n=1 Tax=Vibrio cyclitrophicus TaxID=47951 RepID=UPI000C81BA34|nr:hypothetical protein [Vibrio cyclitrophicus]PMJ21407.1 hypothetical protein BCU28_10465 [Vibrio cyclitrophicus]PMJ38247.1 hypothetical protein BCU24_21115 [Vibrio cyclitrophicus]